MSPVSLRVTNCLHDKGDSNCSVIIYPQIHHFRSKKGTAAEMHTSHSKLFLEWLLGKHPSAIG